MTDEAQYLVSREAFQPRPARVVLEEHADGAVTLSALVWVLAMVPDENGRPLFLVVTPRSNMTPYLADQVRFE